MYGELIFCCKLLMFGSFNDITMVSRTISRSHYKWIDTTYIFMLPFINLSIVGFPEAWVQSSGNECVHNEMKIIHGNNSMYVLPVISIIRIRPLILYNLMHVAWYLSIATSVLCKTKRPSECPADRERLNTTPFTNYPHSRQWMNNRDVPTQILDIPHN